MTNDLNDQPPGANSATVKLAGGRSDKLKHMSKLAALITKTLKLRQSFCFHVPFEYFFRILPGYKLQKLFNFQYEATTDFSTPNKKVIVFSFLYNSSSCKWSDRVFLFRNTRSVALCKINNFYSNIDCGPSHSSE